MFRSAAAELFHLPQTVLAVEEPAVPLPAPSNVLFKEVWILGHLSPGGGWLYGHQLLAPGPPDPHPPTPLAGRVR